MGIGFHLYFNLLKLLYSFIGHRDKKFVILEIIGSAIIILFVLTLESIWYKLIVIDGGIQIGINYFVYGLIFGFMYIGFSILSRVFAKNNPEELSDKNKKVIVSVGIIDFTWVVMLGLVYAGLIFCNEFEILKLPLEKGKGIEYYKLYYDELQYLFNQSVNIILVLGTILAACMTIIWSGEIWRNGDKKSMKQYKSTTIVSIKMVLAFFIIALSIVIWISLPFYLKMTNIKEMLIP